MKMRVVENGYSSALPERQRWRGRTHANSRAETGARSEAANEGLPISHSDYFKVFSRRLSGNLKTISHYRNLQNAEALTRHKTQK